MLVGGGELHERWESLVPVRAPLVARHPALHRASRRRWSTRRRPPELTLPELAEQLEGRVLVAHNASFDRRVLAQAFARAGLAWPDPPTLCTVALARRCTRSRASASCAPLADSLGIEVEVTHRALADAETCARVFCALFPRLCANAGTSARRCALLRSKRRRAPRGGRTDGGRLDARHAPAQGRLLRRCPTTPASTSSATPRASRCTSASR